MFLHGDARGSVKMFLSKVLKVSCSQMEFRTISIHFENLCNICITEINLIPMPKFINVSELVLLNRNIYSHSLSLFCMLVVAHVWQNATSFAFS